MNAYVEYIALPIIALIINCTVLLTAFPRRYSLRFSIAVITVFTVTIYLYDFLTDAFGTSYGGVRGILYIPFVIWLLKERFFQTVFGVLLQLMVTMLLAYLAAAVITLFVPAGSSAYYTILFFVVVTLYAAYVLLMLKVGRLFMQRLFESGRTAEWAIYSLGGLFSFVIIAALRRVTISPGLYIMFLLFIMWAFGVLCFAIINTHEKTKQRADAEFARDIISSGREHYHKMDGMYGKLRMLRHNYKYHLSTVSELLRSGNIDEVRKHLTDAETELSESELTVYCPNTVINALLVSYAERCARLAIKYDVKVTMPDTFSVPNYEMCIILGNLLENAVEACQKQKDSRWVRLLIKPAGAQLVVKVKNSFNGVVAQENGQPVTIKKDGGLGLRSIQAVTDKYGGDLITEWDDKTFTAYVLVGM